MFNYDDLDAQTIGSLGLQDHHGVQLGQPEHRIDLARRWGIKPGESILELGCGQGDMTVVLASIIGDSAKVTALDPAPLDYGSPATLGQAQSHLSNGPLGSRIAFVQADPLEYLRSTNTVFDVAVLAHCIWYFASPTVLLDTFRALAKRAKRVCVAEYALVSSEKTSIPHLLAALTQASLECRKLSSTSNIRTVLSPEAIKKIAAEAGWEVINEDVKIPPKGMFDGRWEVSAVLQDEFREEVESCVKDERERGVVFALRDSVKAGKAALGSEKISTMDIWAADFVFHGHKA